MVMTTKQQTIEEIAKSRISVKPSTRDALKEFSEVSGMSYDESVVYLLSLVQQNGDSIFDAASRIRHGAKAR